MEMSSKERKPFGQIDSNRLHQQRNKQPHPHRRRPQSRSTGGSDSNSIASLVDDSEFDFLSNPKPSLQQLVPSIAKQQFVVAVTTDSSKISTNGAWNSSSKTPKISNVTSLSLKPKIVDDQGVDKSLAQNPAGQKTTNAVGAKADTSSKTPQQFMNKRGAVQKMNVVEKPSNLQTDINRKVTARRKQSRLRSDNSIHNDLSSMTFKSYVYSGMLEAIVEGIPEEENESPVIVHQKEVDDAGHISEENSQFLLSDAQPSRGIDETVVSGHNVPKTEAGAETASKQFQSSTDINIQDEEIGNRSDMDESSDDELMGLTLSPPIAEDAILRNKIVEAVVTTRKETCKPADTLSSPTNQVQAQARWDVPLQGDLIQLKQEQYFHTPTQPVNQNKIGIVKKSTPHPAKHTRSPKKPPTHEGIFKTHQARRKLIPPPMPKLLPQEHQGMINLQGQPMESDPTRPIQSVGLPVVKGGLRDQSPTKHRTITNDHAQSCGDKMNLQNTGEKECSIRFISNNFDKVLYTPTASSNQGRNNGQVNKYQSSTSGNANVLTIAATQLSPLRRAECDVHQNYIATKPTIEQISSRKSLQRTPVDKTVWQAMMGIPSKADSSLVGLVIETPHLKSQNGLYDSESIDGSELTLDTYLSLDITKRCNMDSKTSQVEFAKAKESKPENTLNISNKLVLQPHISEIETTANARDEHNAAINRGQNSPAKTYTSARTITNSNIAPKHTLSNPAIDKGNQSDLKSTPERTNVASAQSTPLSVIKFEHRTTHVQFSPQYGSRHEKKVDTRDHGGYSSPSVQQVIQILEDEVHSGILSQQKKHSVPNRVKPKLWTSEIAGRKFKAFGLNAAPVFRLLDGTYYQHPPLPPGWTVAVSRSHNIPFYIHPDFGATFYSPVPLPSNDGKATGTILLYQADTPPYPPPVNECSIPPKLSTPVIFCGSSLRWSDETSTVTIQNFKMKRLDTPLGALAVATTGTSYFSESQNGKVSNVTLQQHMIGATPNSTTENFNNQLTSGFNDTPDICSTYSADSSTTIADRSLQIPKCNIPSEIEILRELNDVTDEDRFKRDLEKTAGGVQPHPSPGEKNTCNFLQSSHFLPIVGTQSEPKSRTMIDSDDISLEWAADISPGSDESELMRQSQFDGAPESLHGPIYYHDTNQYSHDVVSVPSNVRTPEQLFTSIPAVGSAESRLENEISIPMIHDDLSPFEPTDDNNIGDDPSTCIPRKITVRADLDTDDMSLLQFSPQQSEQDKDHFKSNGPHLEHQRLLLSVCKSALEKDVNGNDDCSFVSMAAGSFFSVHSSKSRASCRSLNPIMKICALQSFIDINTVPSIKRKNQRQSKPAKRRRSIH